MAAGGTRPNSGRKSIAAETKTADLARTAIIEKYGSLEAGLKHLLMSNESALIKFVFEHGFGKPTDKVDVVSNGKTIGQAQEVIIKDFTKK